MQRPQPHGTAARIAHPLPDPVLLVHGLWMNGIELSVLILGFLAGGTIGIGTIVFALGIGPAVQVALRVFDREGRVSKRRRAVLEARGDVGE